MLHFSGACGYGAPHLHAEEPEKTELGFLIGFPSSLVSFGAFADTAHKRAWVLVNT